MNTKELSVTDAVKTFSSEMGTPVRALNSVNLTIPTGSHVAIMGPSGSGKSTLLHCMSGILPLDAGTVMFAGTNLAALREKQRSKIRREHMGFVFQDGALLPELTAQQIEALCEDGTISGGMIPKIAGALDAARSGVNAVHIIDGRVPHAMLLEVLSDQAFGTMIRASAPAV